MRRTLRELGKMERLWRKKLVLGQQQRLTPQGIYDVAHGIASTDIDPASIAKDAAPGEFHPLPPPPGPADPSLALSNPESRATLLVALHKILGGAVRVRKEMPETMAELLNAGGGDSSYTLYNSDYSFVDVGRVVYKAGSFQLAAAELEALELTGDPFGVASASLASHLGSFVSVLADVAAGLSCEAFQAKTSIYEDKFYRLDSTHSSVADAAKVMRALLAKSKEVNFRKGFSDKMIAYVPEVHGSFKESLKDLSGLVRVEINRTASSRTKLPDWPDEKYTSDIAGVNFVLREGLTSFLSSLARLVEFSNLRIKRGLSILPRDNGAELRADWAESVIGSGSVPVRGAEFRPFRECFGMVKTAIDTIALEAAVALMVIGKREAGDGKKVGRGLALGKGTGWSRGVLRNVAGSNPVDGEKDELHRLFLQLREFFSATDGSLEKFIDEVKVLIESNEERRLPQPPKGTRDFGPEQMMIREKAFDIITKVFKRHGAVSLDTPVFELRDTLMGKYGEDSKLIYDLADQGGQMLSLRYDLTVPFARYLAGTSATSMKRYHIAKVYRRDNPSQGRYREFYQCDFDIAGQYPSMVPDAEVIKVLTEVLDSLNLGDYEVKLNHRKLLDGMLAICGVPENKFRSICSAIDKLDKLPWDKVRAEMVNEKGLSGEVADRIGIHVARKGYPLDVLAEIKQQQEYLNHDGSSKALDELTTLFGYLEATRCLNRVVFDMSLARGLDYYTGVIYEAVFRGSTQVGSIAAGGRYDNLVGMFSSKQVPAVGVSLGIERVFLIMEEQRGRSLRPNETQVLVYFLGAGMMSKAMQLANELWSASLNAEFDAFSPSKLKNKLESAAKSGVPYTIIAGEDEEKRQIVKLRDMVSRQETEVPRTDLISVLKSYLNRTENRDRDEPNGE